MSKRIVYGVAGCVIELGVGAPLDHVPKSEELGVAVVEGENGRLVIIKKCRIYCRKTGMQFSPSDLVTFGWIFTDIKSVKTPEGGLIWENLPESV